MSERNEEIKKLAAEALQDEAKLEELVQQLSEGSRRTRQIAASAISLIAKSDAEMLKDYVDAIVDALNRPEAQTRWECLETLVVLVDFDARACGKALAEAESALFDEESGPVRLAALRFLCKYGATTPTRSEKVWPLLDEGIQCYHGDLEFSDMLIAIVDFSAGKIAPSVKKAFADRMAFDAENAKGSLQRRAKLIVENVAG